MAKIELIMPKMGESVAEATIISWHKEVGESIEIDETIVEIATDKVDSEVPSSIEGVIVEKLFDEVENKNVQDLKELSIDKQILDKILKFSSIKYLLNDDNIDQEKIEVFLDEIKRDLKHHELELRIEELEAKFSKDFNENTFNELKELKKLQKIN